jgi:hypothetical protein
MALRTNIMIAALEWEADMLTEPEAVASDPNRTSTALTGQFSMACRRSHVDRLAFTLRSVLAILDNFRTLRMVWNRPQKNEEISRTIVIPTQWHGGKARV